MKKEHLEKLFVFLAVVLIALQFIYREIKWKTGSFNETIRIAEYIVIALIMVVGLLFIRTEDKKLTKPLLMIYAVLLMLFLLFKYRGIV